MEDDTKQFIFPDSVNLIIQRETGVMINETKLALVEIIEILAKLPDHERVEIFWRLHYQYCSLCGKRQEERTANGDFHGCCCQ